MIKIDKLNVSFANYQVLKNASLELPRFGLVVIYGPSGCGKTTLLNSIAGLLTYNGSICIDNVYLEKLSDNDLSDFRLNNYGFIFQDFKLFENETVIDNVVLPLEMHTNLKKIRKENKCKDLLTLVGLKHFYKQTVKKLSGGEKQRVAIARSLVNDPKVILADEPTGALDNKNSKEIMDILERVSLQSLVIVVSHDKELTKKYADIVIEMKDGEIVNKTYHEHHKHEAYLPTMKNGYSAKKQSIPFSFLFRHTNHSIKQRKGRTLICNLVTSLGLIGVGVAVSLSSTISNNIKQAYSSLIDQSKIMVSIKNNQSSTIGQYAGSFYEAIDIRQAYSDYIIDVGVNYIADFESFFPDINNLVIDTNYYTPIEGISVRHINEFEWLDQSNETIYPHSYKSLEDDEVIFGLTIDMVNDICFSLHIVRTVTSLSEYLENNDIYFYFDLANTSWQYEDQQLVRMKGFTLVKNPKIYHTNHMWNEYMLEEMMRFPTLDNMMDNPKYPWVMRKIPYFYLNDKIDEFLSLSRFDETFDPYILEIANQSYYPWMLLGVDIKDVRRVLFFSNNVNSIPLRYVDFFKDVSSNIDTPIYGNNSGYSIFPSSLMMGFSKYTYLSFNEDLITETLDKSSELSMMANESLSLPKGIESGHFSKSMQNGVSFEPISNQNINGTKPISYDEIVISSALYNKLDIFDRHDTLYLSYTINEKLLDNGHYRKYFKTVPLKIVGTIESEKFCLYHNVDWTIGFFQSRMGVSMYNLLATDIALSMKDESLSDNTIEQLKRAFPNYQIINPLSDINESVDEVCKYIGIALFAFSFIATMISTLLLTICNYLHILEDKKEISLARCIGANKMEAKKFLYAHSLYMCLISFILSSFELVSISFMSSYAISNVLSSSLSISFNPLSLVLMFVLALAISLGSTFIISSKISNLNPLQGLKN